MFFRSRKIDLASCGCSCDAKKSNFQWIFSCCAAVASASSSTQILVRIDQLLLCKYVSKFCRFYIVMEQNFAPSMLDNRRRKLNENRLIPMAYFFSLSWHTLTTLLLLLLQRDCCLACLFLPTVSKRLQIKNGQPKRTCIRLQNSCFTFTPKSWNKYCFILCCKRIFDRQFIL